MYPDVVDAGLSEGRRKKVDQAAGTRPDGHWKKSHGNPARIGDYNPLVGAPCATDPPPLQTVGAGAER